MDFPPFNPAEDIQLWLTDVEDVLEEIPQDDWVERTIDSLDDDIRAAIESVRHRVEEHAGNGPWLWTWQRFRATLIGMQHQIQGEDPGTLMERINEFRQQHPVATAAVTIGAVSTGAVVLAPALLVGGLNVVGFTALGPAAGSLAAAAQSAFYGGFVQAGSLFAWAQSAAMGGIAVAPIGAQVAAGTAATAGGWFGLGRPGPLPSRTWDDGENFMPSTALLESLSDLDPILL